MCGIAGKIVISGGVDSATVGRMIARLRHRGPDHADVVAVEGIAALGHARLAILDLSPQGNQPMVDESQRFVITYNGEIYNYRALRDELAATGYRFRTTSDTEVVLAAYSRWKTEAFARFDGMFALAIWDKEQRELVLARDRFGEKPLCYAHRGDVMVFASEVTALLEDEAVKASARISIGALNHYLALGYILWPNTIYEGVVKLPPASFLVYRGHVPVVTRYWDYRGAFLARNRHTRAEVIDTLRVLLQKATESRLVSDVPVGVFISGGLDSSGLAALARRYVTYDLHSFTVGFDEPSYDESQDARVVAEHIGTIHHELRIRQDEGSALMTPAIEVYDEPLSDTSVVATVQLARLASLNVKVVLSGDGADEIFGGYTTYQADALKRRLDLLPAALQRCLALRLKGTLGPGRTKTSLRFKLQQFCKGLGESAQYAHYAWRELHTEAERIALIGPQHRAEIEATHPFLTFARHYQEVQDLEPFAQHLYVDAKTWLADDVLVKMDRAAMAFSLESRSPYLSNDLVAYAATIPPDLKVRGGGLKIALREALTPWVPRATVRKAKAGFASPINSWRADHGENEYRWFNRYVARVWSLGLQPEAGQQARTERGAVAP